MKQSLDSWDMKKLCVFLEERESLIKDMHQIDRKIDRLKKTGPSLREHTSGLMKDRAEHSVAELKMIIKKLSSLENDCMERLQDKSERLKNELLRMRSGQQGIERYDRRSENIPKFLDMKR
jgi:hypothetical protein